MASQWNKSKNEQANKQKQQQTYKITKIEQPVHFQNYPQKGKEN